MDKRFVLFLSFGLVFVSGFSAGVLWRSSFQPSAPSLLPAVSCLSSTMPSADVIGLEAQIAKALEDPDFKRIHDYLNRENPIQLEIPTKPEPPQEQVPMTERPPVRFTLE